MWKRDITCKLSGLLIQHQKSCFLSKCCLLVSQLEVHMRKWWPHFQVLDHCPPLSLSLSHPLIMWGLEETYTVTLPWGRQAPTRKLYPTGKLLHSLMKILAAKSLNQLLKKILKLGFLGPWELGLCLNRRMEWEKGGEN